MDSTRYRRAATALAVSSALSILAGGAGGSAWAEDLRALVAGVVLIAPDNADGTRLAIGYDESVAVIMPKDSPFVQGFEIEIRSPQAVIAAPGGFAYELWRRIAPAPDRKRLDYSGDRVLMQPLPARAGYAIQIPVKPDNSIKPSPYATLIPTLVEQKDFPFLFRLVPIAKGLSPDVESAKFQVRVRPLLSDEGALSIKLRYPEGASGGAPQGAVEHYPIEATVDDKKIDPSQPVLLKSGPHTLVISSEAYRDESRSFALDQGMTLELVVELQDTTPVLVIEAPDSAIVSLDGARIDQVAKPSMTMEPGEHSVTCRIGDYTLTRKFTAYRGKSYRLVLQVDLQVQEEQ